MAQTFREVYQMVERVHLRVVDQKIGGTGHLRLVVEAPNGIRETFTFAKTLSDHRGSLNAEARLKRFARANELPTAMQNALAKVARREDKPKPKEPEMTAPLSLASGTTEPTKEGPHRTGEGKRLVNRLDSSITFRLFKWFENLPQEVIDREPLEAIAKMAEGVLETPITKGNIQGAFDATGRKRTPIAQISSETSHHRLDALEHRVAALEAAMAAQQNGYSHHG